MEPTTPDPQTQQPAASQQQPQQQQQQQQPQQSQQPQQLQMPTQPKPQQHLQHQHQHHQTTPQAYTSYPYGYAPRGYQPYPPAYTQAYPYNYHNPAWATPANFTPAPAPISSMVNPQQQPNVPQQHTKQSQPMINTTINSDRTHSQSLPQQVTITNPTTPVVKARPRKPAILKDPSTNEVITLDTPSSTKSPTSTVKSTPKASTASTTTASVELLQKVSEYNATSAEPTNNQPNKKQAPPKQTVADAKSESKAVKPASETCTVGAPTASTTVPAGSAIPTTTPTPQSPTKVDAKLDDKLEKKDEQASPVLQSVVEEEKQLPEVSQTKVPDEGTDKSTPPQEESRPESSQTDKVQDEKSTPESPLKASNQDEEAVVVDGDANANSPEDGEDSKKNEGETDSEEPLQYEPWQYNPKSNRTGKKVYSKQFLLDVCERICKINLSQKESDDKIGSEASQLPSAFGERFDMFAPSFHSAHSKFPSANRQNEQARRTGQNNYSGRSSAGQEKQRKIITSASLTQEVELKTVSNPWRPAKDVKEDAPADTVETESLKKKFRSILNKLTPNNFENLSRAVTDLNIDTESKLGEVIDIVFAKALAEPGYCVLYGQMCSHLKKITAGQANFGNTLLRRCQNQFQSDIYAGLNLDERRDKIEKEDEADVKKQMNEELYEDMYRCRMRGLGLIKFIGELYKIEMLNDAIMFSCIQRLLGDTSEESLECLCDLLVTIGQKLDRSSKKSLDTDKRQPRSASKANAYQGGQKSAAAVVASGSTAAQQKVAEQTEGFKTLDPVFEQLHKIRKNKDLPLSVRIRFKLLDTCELREKENWQSKKTKDNNPKKIEEIRKDHEEKLDQERRQTAIGSRRSQEGNRRGLGQGSGSSNQISSLANESGGRGTTGLHSSSSSHMLRDHSIGDMKTNHNDFETQKEHQRKLEFLKGSQVLGSIKPNKIPAPGELSKSDFQLRPTIGLRPNTQSAATPSPSGGTSS